ncbi:MAG: hypothetical protein U0797_06100 [Gemmataceae bacterium]
MTARIILLTTAALAFALLGILARSLGGGDEALLHCLTAVLLCLVPGVVTLAATHWAAANDPRKAPLLALGASGVRMFGVLLVALALHLNVPLYQGAGFLFWVAGAYLWLLAVEVALLVRGRLSSHQTTAPGEPG